MNSSTSRYLYMLNNILKYFYSTTFPLIANNCHKISFFYAVTFQELLCIFEEPIFFIALIEALNLVECGEKNTLPAKNFFLKISIISANALKKMFVCQIEANKRRSIQ